MLEEEFSDVLSALGGQPSPAVQKRAEAEEETTLKSGRSPIEVIDLAGDLIETLRDLWDNEQLIRVPAPARRTLLTHASLLAEAADQYGSGLSNSQALETAVDKLHTALWQNGLIDRVEHLPGYEAKNKRLESLIRKGRRTVRELEKGLETKERLSNLSTALEEAVKKATSRQAEIEQLSVEARQQKTDLGQTVADVTQHAQQTTTLVGQVRGELDRATSLANDVDALKTPVERFHTEIAANESKLNAIVDLAEKTITENQTATDDLLERLAGLEEQIDDQLQKATGASLFRAFNARRKSLSRGSWIWAILSVASLAFTVWWGGQLAAALANVPAGPDGAFFLRLGAVLPLVTVIVFCMSQYGRERRTEEEYAFKSALSLSLVPYKDLIEALETGEFEPEYAKFLVRTIGQIYEAPRVTKEKIDAPADMISVKALESLAKAISKIR